MADPYRVTLFAGTPEHNAFGPMLVLAEEGCRNDEGFLQTIRTHRIKFKPNENYELLTDDYKYVVELASQELIRQHHLSN